MINTLLGGALGVVVWLIAVAFARWAYRREMSQDTVYGNVLELCEEVCSPFACACWVAIGALIGVLTI
jgi:hypothetical protein